jgi:transketolase
VNLLDRLPLESGKPTAVIAHTIKTKGLSFAEGCVEYHYWKPKKEELKKAEQELDEFAHRFADQGGVL